MKAKLLALGAGILLSTAILLLLAAALPPEPCPSGWSICEQD